MVDLIVKALKEHGAIEFGSFVLSSGAVSSYYVDVKSAVTDPALLSLIGAEIADRCRFEVVAGVAVGAVPLAVAVSLASGKPYAIIRKGEKGHGKPGTIVGDVSGRKVLLVEDVTTSGGSVLAGIRMLREAGAMVDTVVAVVDRGQGAAALLSEAGVRLLPLARIGQLLND
jgi:orotate phosphoribosyltransferase